MTPLDIVEAARDIALEYREQRLTLTLRQMYYQFVSRGLLPNGQKHYKRIGAVLTDARYAGAYPVSWLEDRGRTVGESSATVHQVNVARAMSSAGRELAEAPQRWLWSARWYKQPKLVSVWVEKEALAGVFEDPCKDLGVGLFACKGYPSVSALDSWLQHLEDVNPDEAVILYFGDHDPDGFEIPRSTLRSIDQLRAVRWAREAADDPDDHFQVARLLPHYKPSKQPPVRLERVALNIDQVRQHNPPPFPAKPSSSRYRSYVEEHGIDDAWELDALEPSLLQRLIRSEVDKHFDDWTYQDNQAQVHHARRQMTRELASVLDVLRGGADAEE